MQQQPRGIYKGQCVWAAHPANAGPCALTGMVGKVVLSPTRNPCSPCQRDVLGIGTGRVGSCHGTGPLHCLAGPGGLIQCPGQSLGTPAPGTTRIALWDLVTVSEVVKLKDGKWEGVEGTKTRGSFFGRSCFGRSCEELAWEIVDLSQI